MKHILSILVVIVLIIGGMYYLLQDNYFESLSKMDEQVKPMELPNVETNQETKELLPLLKGDLYSWMGEKSKKVKKEFGEPASIHTTPYGYSWWVYTNGKDNYIQFGIADNQVQTIFATGDTISASPFEIGDSYEEIKELLPIEDKITYQDGQAFYSFILSEEDQKLKPLFKISDRMFVQTYIDTVTNEVSSIRLLTGDMMLKQRFYEIEYRGELPEPIELSEKDWSEVAKGMEQQIYDLTNIYRERFKMPDVQKDDAVREVAYLHSKDMYEHHYFSHYSEDGKGLKERLADNEVYYLSAGENIAAQYTDAPAAMEGWLNSESHREALLFEDYTHLGVGVYHLYYTQNFLLKP